MAEAEPGQLSSVQVTMSRQSDSSSDQDKLLGAGDAAGPTSAQNRRRFIEGIVLLVAVNVIWVAASVLVQYIYQDLGFNQPFFITYVSNSLFLVYLPGVPVYRQIAKWLCSPRDPEQAGLSAAESFSLRKTAKVALYICPVWFTAQCTYNASLDWTSISSSTILSTVSGLFTFVLCLLFLGEQFKWVKIIGVVATILGAVLVGLSDSETEDAGKDTFGGDAIALFSAFCYALYTSMIRYFIPNEHAVSMPLFFGFLGLFNCILLLPVLLILAATGTITFTGLTFGTFCFIVLKGLVDNVLSDLLWARAVLLTSPTIATIALSLTIPFSMISDWLFKGLLPAGLLVVGAVAVLIGFISINLGGQLTDESTSKTQRRPSCREALAKLPCCH